MDKYQHPIVKRIREWLRWNPEHEFGPGHIVFSDYNLFDGHIEWCIGLIDARLAGVVPDSYVREDFDEEDLLTSRAFLCQLYLDPDREDYLERYG